MKKAVIYGFFRFPHMSANANYPQRRECFQEAKSKPVIIEENVFVGAQCIILKGSCIGRNSVVGAGSVVSANIPENEVWAGNPARFVRKI